MRRAAAATIGALLALGACAPAAPEIPAGVSVADIAAFRSAVTNAGCAVAGPGQAGPVESSTGFGGDKLRAITIYLAQMGEVVQLETGGIRLVSGPCRTG